SILKDLKQVVVIVRDLEKTVEDYHYLFEVQPSPIAEVAYGLRGASIPIGAGETFLELVSPSDPTSPGARYLERRGQGLYLLGLEVYDWESAVQHVQDRGGVITQTAHREHVPTAWVHPKSTGGVFIQLSQAR
ncbi:MAG: VOC family protein, partial [Anaerolineae bacterium]